MEPNDPTESWVAAAPVDQLSKRRKLKVETAGGDLVLFWHAGCPHALANICVHKDRELVNGTVFDGRVVCPGHQWAFDLTTGYCRERERTQPVHDTRIDDGVVYVNLMPRTSEGMQP